MKEQVVVNKLW